MFSLTMISLAVTVIRTGIVGARGGAGGEGRTPVAVGCRVIVGVWVKSTSGVLVGSRVSVGLTRSVGEGGTAVVGLTLGVGVSTAVGVAVGGSGVKVGSSVAVGSSVDVTCISALVGGGGSGIVLVAVGTLGAG